MRLLVVASCCAALAACATGAEHVQTEPERATVAGPPAAVAERATASLGRLGFEVEPASGLIVRATRRAGADPAWANCGRVLVVYNQSEQAVLRSWVSPQTRSAVAEIDVAPAPGSGAMVTVSARFSATYVDWYRNTPFEHACTSTGVLERQVLHDLEAPKDLH